MKKFSLLIVLCLAISAQAVNQSYYSSLNGKSGDALRAALTELLYTKHTTFVSYNWDFPYDYDSDGNMLDIYSDCGYNNHNTYPSSYKCCCDAVNREHVVCQSSFGGSTNNGKVPQYSDRHHLYPVDGRANGHRSDLPFGECSGGKHGSCSSASTIIPGEGTSTCENHEYGRSGASTFSVALPSGGGSVYEVGDEYKGDIARAILYMVVRYADKAHCRLPDNAKNATTALKTQNDYPVTAWANTTRDKVGQMFSSSLGTNYGLSNYGKALLLKWHRQDPVSAKEIARNNDVETAQGNRNPFVDYPCLVEYLWGEHAGETVTLSDLVGSFQDGFSGDGCSNSASPSIVRPTETINLGATTSGVKVTTSVIVQGANLTSNLTLSVTGTNAAYFSLSQTSMTKNVATNGKSITISYQPTASGNHTATLCISGGGMASNHDVTLNGSCCDQYTVTLSRNGQTEVINACGTYNLPTANTEDDACSGWTFRGWSTNSSYNSTTAPSYTTSVSSAATLYAVYGYTTGGSSDTTITMKSYEAAVGSMGSFTFTRAGGGTAPAYNSTGKDARFYAKNILAISNSQTMISIVFNLSTQGKDRLATITANTGTISTQTAGDETVTWSGSADSVAFTVSDKATYGSDDTKAGQLCFSSVTITRTTGSTTYKTAPCPNYTIALAGDDGIMAGGQVFASAAAAIAGTTITLEAAPEDGYSFDGWNVYKTDAPGIKVTVTDNQFTMPSYNVTVSATFTQIPTYTATWMVNGSRYRTQAGVYTNESPSLPDDPDNCSATRVFEGWTTQANYAHASAAPNDRFTTAAPALTRDTTFYAVFADKETTGGTTDTTIIMESYEAISGTFGSFTFVAKKDSGATNPAYNSTNKDARLYAKGSLTISCSQSMTRIVFNLSSQGKNKLAPITASSGSIATQNAGDETVTWTGSATSVTFVVGAKATYGKTTTDAGQLCFTSVDIRRGSTPVTTYSNYSLHCSEATYTLTFMAKGNEHATRSGHQDEVIASVAEPEGCSTYAFVGWSTNTYAANNTATPTLNYTGRVPSENTTYYAVYSNAGSVVKLDDYQRITQLSDLTTGNYVIVAENDSLCALSTITKDTYYFAGVKVVPTAGIISNPAGSILWQITVNGNLAKIYNAEANGYLYIEQNGKYYNLKLGNNLIDNAFTFAVEDNKWTFTSVTYNTQVIEYYISATRWAFYKSPDAPIYLYKQQPDPNAEVFYTTSPSCSVTPTGINNTTADETAVKELYNGQIVIRRGNTRYTLLGQEWR